MIIVNCDNIYNKTREKTKMNDNFYEIIQGKYFNL